MKLKELSKDELETMSYGELSELVLNDNGSKMKIVDIFKKICTLLELSEAEFENKIADFFELISTDKKFIVLDKGFCDLRKKHTPEVIIEEEEEEVIDSEVSEEDEIEENLEENDGDIFYDSSSEEDDVEDSDDELTDFIVVDEDETSM